MARVGAARPGAIPARPSPPTMRYHALAQMRFADTDSDAAPTHRYRVIAVNTAGLKSEPTRSD